jgi:VCBS repeat-containing protein
MEKNGVDLATAKDAVAKSMGIDGKAVDLTSYDPLAVLATKPNDPTALLVEKKMAMLGQLANDAAQNPDTGLTAQTATAKLFDNLAVLSKSGTLDLTNILTLDTATLHVINPAKLLTSELQFKLKGLSDASNVTDLANSQTQAVNNLKATINFATGNDQGTATEDGKLNASGEFTVADPDNGQNKTQVQTATAGTYGNFSLTDKGAWAYQLNNASGAVQSLRAGEVVTDKFTVTSFDGSAQQQVTITITGTNDKPVVSAALVSARTEGTGKFDVNLLADATDADAGETATLSVVDNSLTYKVDNGLTSTNVPGGLSHMAQSNALNLDTNSTAFDYLATGEKTQVLVSYQIKDAQSVVVQQTATLTINGTNDSPVISQQKDDVALVNMVEPALPTSLKTMGTLTLRDADTTDKVNVQVSAVKLGGTVGTLTQDAVKAMLTLGGNVNNEASVNTSNNLTWAFESGTEYFKFLGQDQTLTLTYTLQATDTSNSPMSSSQDVVINIKGTNDAPVINAITPIASADRTITELSNMKGSTVLRTLEGVITISDPDQNTDLSKLKITATPDGNTDFPGSFTIDAPDAAGHAVWHYAIQDKYLDPLKGSLGGSPPDSHTLDHVFVVNDGSGMSNGIWPCLCHATWG